jgi:hypothetical protein
MILVNIDRGKLNISFPFVFVRLLETFDRRRPKSTDCNQEQYPIEFCAMFPIRTTKTALKKGKRAARSESLLGVEGSEPEDVCATAIPPLSIRHSIL